MPRITYIKDQTALLNLDVLPVESGMMGETRLFDIKTTFFCRYKQRPFFLCIFIKSLLIGEGCNKSCYPMPSG